MYVREVVIDGFKSYAYKTEIKNFDREFNAITGLNGSGKSNILDAICFVLGISNLSQVRVNNLQELIYKNGQAGITKATVSVIFDNTFKSQSPIGFENSNEIIITRQIISGGKNKYLINGYNATNSRVNDLFRSVNLNVNNPHFLIMQGRITKVLNMKSIEILSLIEEAVGTKLYDTKRNSALKIIEKKDFKLEEIHRVIKEEIMPMLEKLNNDKSSYLEYQKLSQDIEHFDKIHKAYLFYHYQENHNKTQVKLTEHNEKTHKVNNEIIEIDIKISHLDKTIADLEKCMGKEKGMLLEKMESQLNQNLKEQSKLESKVSNMAKNFEADQEKLIEWQNLITQETQSKEKCCLKIEQLNEIIKKLEEQCHLSKVTFEKAQSKLEACNLGMFEQPEQDKTDGTGKKESLTLNQQLINLKSKVSELEHERDQCEMKIQHAKSVLSGQLEDSRSSTNKKSANKRDSGREDVEFQESLKLLQSMRKTLENLKSEMAKHDYTVDANNEKRDHGFIEGQDKLARDITNLEREIALKEGNYPQLKFTFQEFPALKQDSAKVKGKIMNMIESIGTDSKKYVTAVEVAAGGKLNFVVVDSEQTGKEILKHGKLAYRTTFIPLNKITPKMLKPEVVRCAIALGGGNPDNVCPLINLINYSDKSLTPAMQFVFGSTLLCKDIEIAKKVAFHPSVRQRCVTLEGDVIEPQGTVSGGYLNPSSFSPLTKCLEINNLKAQLFRLIEMSQSRSSELSALKLRQSRFRELHRLIELKTRETESLDFKLKNNPIYQKQQENENTKKILDEETGNMANIENAINTCIKNIKEIEKKLKNLDSYQESQINEAKKLLQSSKEETEKCQNKLKKANLEYESMKASIIDNEQNIINYENQIQSLQQAMQSNEQSYSKLSQDFDKIKMDIDALKERIESEKSAMLLNNKEINAKIHEKKTLSKHKTELQLSLQKLEQDGHNYQNTLKNILESVNKLNHDYKWIKEESIYFGKPNTIYDFSKLKMNEVESKLVKFKERKQQLSRIVNNRALSMLESVEEKYKELMNKKMTLVADKRKIEELIKELDEKKRLTIEKAYVQVNKDFGSIFTTLLPGASAKLVALDGQNILQGLEIKVSFNDVWKESLTELSGGQRSLIALSLILALLLFKPAPIYILDEIDAALDASHTQNIGIMLSRHFKQSQFIVVSLKDGMFQNANVLFKTALIEGRSTVTRYTK